MGTQQVWADPLDAGAPEFPISNYYGWFHSGIPVVAPDQAALKQKLEDTAVSMPSFEVANEKVLLKVICRCGQAYSYPALDDIPVESVRCSCGRWIIQYTEATP